MRDNVKLIDNTGTPLGTATIGGVPVLKVDVVAGGGGASDATAANQVTGNNSLATLASAIETYGSTKAMRAVSGLAPAGYDYIGYTANSSTIDTWVYKSGGASGTTLRTVVVTYSAADHETINTVAVS